jgi:ribosomal protein S18 acetylase RimI-like enzyme
MAASRSGSTAPRAVTIPQIPHTRGNSTSRYGGRLPLPSPDYELVRRLEEANARYSIALLEALRDLPESDLDLRLERFGAAVAPASPRAPELDFVNRIEGLRAADAGRVGELLPYYAAAGVDPWIELAPEPGLDELGAALAPAGPRLVAFYAVLFGPPESRPIDLDVRRAEAEEAESAGRLLLEGREVPEPARSRHGRALASAVERACGWLYVARVDGMPAAAAVLSFSDSVGFLANAATLPAFRGRGCQTALIAARLADARASGCDLVSSGAAFGSQSQRNLERAGLRVAYTKPVLRLSSRGAGRRGRTA